MAQASADSVQGCVPFTVNFSDASGGGSRIWQIDGQTFTSANPAYLPGGIRMKLPDLRHR